MSLDEWNRRYCAREAIDGEPASVLVDAVRGLTPGRALDLACGAGRNALWLVGQGWAVTAIDGASEAIRIVRELDPAIDARVLDLETDAPLPFPDLSFDLVAILYFLHRLFAEAMRVAKPGGLAVAAIRTSGINPRFCVARGELRSYFSEWDVLHDAEGEIAEIVARKR